MLHAENATDFDFIFSSFYKHEVICLGVASAALLAACVSMHRGTYKTRWNVREDGAIPSLPRNCKACSASSVQGATAPSPVRSVPQHGSHWSQSAHGKAAARCVHASQETGSARHPNRAPRGAKEIRLEDLSDIAARTFVRSQIRLSFYACRLHSCAPCGVCSRIRDGPAGPPNPQRCSRVDR